MDQTYDRFEDPTQNGALELTEDFSDAESAAEEIKPFQVATLFQEVERIGQGFSELQMDEFLLSA